MYVFTAGSCGKKNTEKRAGLIGKSSVTKSNIGLATNNEHTVENKIAKGDTVLKDSTSHPLSPLTVTNNFPNEIDSFFNQQLKSFYEQFPQNSFDTHARDEKYCRIIELDRNISVVGNKISARIEKTRRGMNVSGLWASARLDLERESKFVKNKS